MKVLFVITTLDVGGAEKVLLELLRAVDSSRMEARVLCLSAGGALLAEFRALGLTVDCQPLRGCPWDPLRAWRVWRAIRSWRPDVVYASMYHACLAAVLARGRARLVWAIHNTNVALRDLGPGTWLVVRLLALLSRKAGHIVYVSQASLAAHEALGFARDKSRWIPNGFDTRRFCPGAKDSLRLELGLPADAPLVGLVSRDGPQKNVADFLRAAAFIARARPGVCFACCGTGLDAGNARLVALTRELDLEGRLYWLGVRHDMPRVYNALDLLVLPSSGESLPNVLGEALACGVPCVATDTGDCARLVGPGGFIVAPGRVEEMAAACLRILDMDSAARSALGLAGRVHIAKNFPSDRALAQTLALIGGES